MENGSYYLYNEEKNIFKCDKTGLVKEELLQHIILLLKYSVFQPVAALV